MVKYCQSFLKSYNDIHYSALDILHNQWMLLKKIIYNDIEYLMSITKIELASMHVIKLAEEIKI